MEIAQVRKRVLIADDHTLVRRGLRAILESDPEWEVCGEASSGLEAVTKARELLPDVVIMDVSMPGTSGLEATRQIVQTQSGIAVLIVSVHESIQLVSAAREAGARGYLFKIDSDVHLIEALKALCRHETYFPAMSGEDGPGGRRFGRVARPPEPE
jgi:DNA-binding NarL/FixJ family response regulator